MLAYLTQRPERTVYALTDAGRRELRDWLRELVGTPEHEYPRFVAALSLIAALPRTRSSPCSASGHGCWAPSSPRSGR
ncbi:hypothetical protein B0I33_10314 [Prauserella shujinwangii]|uniref:Transcription regulator PadR N-terminal domain-containing protein n=1 Tax=Prauserella shujinwangii TaxID=1453103 RepID=A0A2T0LY49_9PSEU|nr:hypothetical protein [Prauserella shujinwangii]PRX48982.1 hypothetical protein B0I33_10314 [Prauserella shujinwangii]